MPGARGPRHPPPASRRALARYAAGWLAAGAVAALALFVVLEPLGGDDVQLPPVRQIDLQRAAQEADCELRRDGPRRHLNPAADGDPRVGPARPGRYDDPVRAPSLVAALRRGIVVVQYRPGLPADEVDQLRALLDDLPKGTIVTPNATGMPYAVAATAWRRVLGCRRFDQTTIDALRLFRGRFVGGGPGP